MAVGDDKPLHLLNILLQICHIRDADVNTQHIVAGKSQSAVHHDNIVLIFNGCHIQSDLFQSAQGDDLHLDRLALTLVLFLALLSQSDSSNSLFFILLVPAFAVFFVFSTSDSFSSGPSAALFFPRVFSQARQYP